MHKDYIINHLGEDRKKYFNAVSPPIIQSSNFVFDDIESFREAIKDEKGNHIYTRGNNPTVAILRKKLAALEHTEDCLVFSSGSAAIAAAVMSHAKNGDHVVCVNNPYSWTVNLLTKYLADYGVTHTFVDGKNSEEIENAFQENTTILYLESPNTATFELQDLEACATLAKSKGVITMIDNSYTSPLFQNPADYGIDVIIHSATKYINGHSDVVMGVVCSSEQIIEKIFINEYMTVGAIVSPHDAALVLRGLRTLKVRMKLIHENAQVVIDYLDNHPIVEKVLYPFHKDFPQLELAHKQMTGAGGLFSILLKADNKEQVYNFVKHIKHFLFAVSWGGHESLILPFISLFDIPGHPEPSVPWNLIRFYVGMEDPEFLIDGLEKGFTGM
ncbi:PLP-dependent aspartate aminotransferase family protein [Saprospiraceae bacterium]|nr:PLP-dependent aspartate aminotransferase family protein [Saprospiraceae bacterium]